MKIIIDTEKKEVEYPQNVTLQDLGASLNNLFENEAWRKYKIVINERIDEDPDTGGYREEDYNLPF